MKALALVLLATTGCGVARYNKVVSCYNFHSDIPWGNEAALETDARLSLEVLHDRLGIDLCRSGWVDVEIVDEIVGLDGKEKGGYSEAGFRIFIHPDLYSLPHESLHLWDFRHLAVGSAWHTGWATNGYDAAGLEYLKRMTRIKPQIVFEGRSP